MADKRIDQLVAATTVGDDDLLVLQQNNQAKKLSGKKLGDYVYAAAAEKVSEVEAIVAEAQEAVDSLEEQKNEIAQTIASMAELGTDTTLTTPGMAADAAATGEVKDIALGRFEQGSSSGSIVTFEDGADNVPIKSLIVDITPVQSGSGDPSPTNIRTISERTDTDVVVAGKNLCGGNLMLSTFAACGLDMTRVGSDADGRYYECYSHNVSNSKTYIPKWFFKPNTVYTFIFSLKSASANPNFRIFYTDGSNTGIFPPSVPTTKTIHITRSSSGKTVSRLGGYYSNANNAKLYVDECCVLEGNYTNEQATAAYETCKGTMYNILFPASAGTVYGGKVDVINGKLYVDTILYTLTGSVGSWLYNARSEENQNVSVTFEANSLYELSHNVRDVICTHLKTLPTDKTSVTQVPHGNAISIRTTYTGFVMSFDYDLFPDVNWSSEVTTDDQARDIIATYATDQYNNGTPINVAVKKKEPVVYDLTPTEVTTLLGLNNIFAKTGDITALTYYKMPTSTDEVYNTIESMISGVEQTMETTHNYTSDNLVVAVHKLYHIVDNIAQGETLEPGQNCYETTVAAELGNLAATISAEIGSLGNIASLTYEVVT